MFSNGLAVIYTICDVYVMLFMPTSEWIFWWGDWIVAGGRCASGSTSPWELVGFGVVNLRLWGGSSGPVWEICGRCDVRARGLFGCAGL